MVARGASDCGVEGENEVERERERGDVEGRRGLEKCSVPLSGGTGSLTPRLPRNIFAVPITDMIDLPIE